MDVYMSIQDMIGNTPMLKLNNMGIREQVGVYAKLELLNPEGSIKDRVGMYMLNEAIESGRLQPGGTIVEATAGNTGIGIAIAALNRGYQVIFTVPTKFSVEKQKIMKALGAKVVNTKKKAAELIKEIPGAISLGQFHNPANPLAHYETTGPEIYRQMDGKIDYFVAGAGSGGTFSGVMRYLKEKNPEIKGVLADPVGSVIGGGEHADYDIEGIGNDFIADTMDMSLVDMVIKVTDQDAFNMSRLLAGREGVLAGTSSGAALSAAIKLSERTDHGNIVVMFPDKGERYLREVRSTFLIARLRSAGGFNL